MIVRERGNEQHYFHLCFLILNGGFRPVGTMLNNVGILPKKSFCLQDMALAPKDCHFVADIRLPIALLLISRQPSPKKSRLNGLCLALACVL